MEIIKVNEGKAEIFVPENKKISSEIPFFNPLMKFNRDFSIGVAKALKVKKFLDGLSACGALSIRMKKEIGDIEVHANELNKETIKFLERNKEHNNVDIKIHNKDLNLLLNEENDFDFIDIDPFGSPVNFLSNVMLNARHNTIIGITATDLGTLCGRFNNACLRRYGTISMQNEFEKEFGLRNLISYAARTAGKYETGIEILFSYYFMHYFKVYFRIKRSRSYADKTLKNIGFILYCDKCTNRKYISIENFQDNDYEIFCDCKNKFKILGPIWKDKFGNEDICDMLSKEVREKTELKILELVKEEQKICIPYYDIHKICKINKIQIKKTEDIIKKAEEMKIKSTKTHFDGKGLRFGENLKELIKILKEN